MRYQRTFTKTYNATSFFKNGIITNSTLSSGYGIIYTLRCIVFKWYVILYCLYEEYHIEKSDDRHTVMECRITRMFKMTRGIWIKWIFGAAFLLLIVAVGCILYYQHTTAPYKAEAVKDDKLLKQWEADKAKATITAEKESTITPVESTAPTAEKSKTDATTMTDVSIGETKKTVTALTQQTDKTEDVLVSPHGFGPYPNVPEDYPSTVSWERDQTHLPEELSHQSELLSRVLVKLWTSGEKNFRGGSTYNGKVYAHYHDTVYVRFTETRNASGETVRYPARIKSGPNVRYTEADLLDPPSHLRVLDLDTSGIDPYQYLNISR